MKVALDIATLFVAALFVVNAVLDWQKERTRLTGGWLPAHHATIRNHCSFALPSGARSDRLSSLRHLPSPISGTRVDTPAKRKRPAGFRRRAFLARPYAISVVVT